MCAPLYICVWMHVMVYRFARVFNFKMHVMVYRQACEHVRTPLYLCVDACYGIQVCACLQL